MKSSIFHLSKLLTVIIFMMFFYPVWAADTCKFSAQQVNLGSKSSYNIATTAASSSGAAGMSCSGLSISILGSNDINAKLSSTTNNLKLVNSLGDSIPYTLYADQAYSKPFLIGTNFSYKSSSLLNIVLGSQGITIPIYVKTANNINVSAGTYTDTANFIWNYDICGGLGIGGLICTDSWTSTNDSKKSSVAITLEVTKDCLIGNTPDVDFGAQSFVGQFNTKENTITLSCTAQEGYVTYFSDGAYSANGWRRMKNSTSNNYLEYNIYLYNNDTVVWNSANPQAGVGTGTNQDIKYKVKINNQQAEQPAGVYTDNMVFTVFY
ncbi:Csu type fimbrial protein [Neisseria sp. Ec49-e6-T10]|uniref:Csu type fimbrial protein n=1 Tax=Neisseria sp. Ec49-e6-T10 TaxID=3140744 RepID=UPI003EBB7599